MIGINVSAWKVVSFLLIDALDLPLDVKRAAPIRITEHFAAVTLHHIH